jgi:hypothetical protein
VPRLKQKLSKFIRGARVTDLSDLMFIIEHGGWVYINWKTYHPDFVMYMTIQSLRRFIANGQIEQAILRTSMKGGNKHAR